MWVYQKEVGTEFNSDTGKAERVERWNVGYFLPSGGFQETEIYKTIWEAREAVNFLNGGNMQVDIAGTVDIGTTGL